MASSNSNSTTWSADFDVDPIRIQDPIAEALGLVPEGDPLVVNFRDVVKAVGYATPAVAGAFYMTDVALDDLFEGQPVRGEMKIVVDGDTDDPDLQQMTETARYITGAGTEVGGLGDFGERDDRDDLLEFGDVQAAEADGQTLKFECETDSGGVDAVVTTFFPSRVGAGELNDLLEKVVEGSASEEEEDEFRREWHDLIQEILDASIGTGPFSVTKTGDPGDLPF